MNLRRKIKLFALCIIPLAAIVYFWPQYQKQLSLSAPTKSDALAEIARVSVDAPLSLITEPDEGMTPVVEAIQHARTSIDLVAYELEDSAVEQALADAKNRGIAVRVLLDQSSHFGKKPNTAAYAFLQGQNVPVAWAKNYFPITHQKTLVVDGAEAIIMTFNFAPQYYQSSRDFGIVDDDPADVAAIETTFNSDWNGTQELADNADDLVWSPGSAQTLVALIDSASASLDIYNEELADPRIIDALKKSAGRGVNVRIDMTYATQWKQVFQELADSGVHVRTYASEAPLFIHAKVILADDARAFVGSENFSIPSLDNNRELGILLLRQDIIASIKKTFDNDWEKARPSSNAPVSSDHVQAYSSPEASSIKLSANGICHTPDDSSYARTKNFTSYPTLQDCLKAGGRLPVK